MPKYKPDKQDWKNDFRKWLNDKLLHTPKVYKEATILHVELYFIEPLKTDRDMYKLILESANKKGQELIEENASLLKENAELKEKIKAMVENERDHLEARIKP